MEEKRINEEETIDLGALFSELLNHWKMIVLSAVLVGAIGLLISEFLITPQYQSTSELYVLSKSTSITSLADIQMGTNLTNDYMVTVAGRPILDQVIENLGLNETYGSLKGKISLNNPTDSRILQITVTDEDPVRAKQIADEMAKVASAFISEKMVQDPPTILSYGYADGGAISPSVKKNAVMAGMLGAVAAMAVVIVSYLVNDSVTNAEDVERKLGLNLLGTVPYEEVEEEDGRKSKKNKGKRK